MSATRRGGSLTAWLFLAPYLVLFGGFVLLPILFGLWISLHNWDFTLPGKPFVGLDNYARAVTDPAFLSGTWRMVRFLLIQVPIMLGLALLFALALDTGLMRFARFVRLSIYVPFAVPGVVAALRERHNGPVDRAVVLGGGATAASAIVGLADRGLCIMATTLVAKDEARPGRDCAWVPICDCSMDITGSSTFTTCTPRRRQVVSRSFRSALSMTVDSTGPGSASIPSSTRCSWNRVRIRLQRW